MLVNRIASLVTILLLTGTAMAGDFPNLLLGKWKLSAEPAPSPYCIAQVGFTTTTYTRTDADGKASSIPVTYVTAQSTTVTFPTSVYVMTDAGAYYHTTYIFKASKDRMLLDTALQCQYARQ
jgi:hypothetical protein